MRRAGTGIDADHDGRVADALLQGRRVFRVVAGKPEGVTRRRRLLSTMPPNGLSPLRSTCARAADGGIVKGGDGVRWRWECR